MRISYDQTLKAPGDFVMIMFKKLLHYRLPLLSIKFRG